ncbi:hypothetical protein [Tsukamurella tyrosinosolvens]|uniref:hypothetical protein n=1 Tax=Tsukamurella tyrosinosolvens TaxID=57704 RepID=UPI002DD4256A|nr:hypothetical protein [Tsukamurella tyrosinosolvens]MEC4616317.1 hypothetical protein [Tsukamurella tyrosinosolvens]
MSAWNAALRLGVMAGLTYLDVHVVLWDPTIGWALFVVLLATAVVWTVRAYQEASAEARALSAAADAAVGRVLGPDMRAIAVERHAERWEAQL